MDQSEVPNVVLCLDRDQTVDVNPHPDRRCLPLAWVKHYAHDRDDIDVWATGNQSLSVEAQIPGSAHAEAYVNHINDRRDTHIDADIYGPDDMAIHQERILLDRGKRLHRIHAIYDALCRVAETSKPRFIVVDDMNTANVDYFRYYTAWDFVDAVENGRGPIEPADPEGWKDEAFAPSDPGPGLAYHYPHAFEGAREASPEQVGEAITKEY